MFTLIILGTIMWFAYRHVSNKKRAADRQNWSVNFDNRATRPVTRRLRWKELP